VFKDHSLRSSAFFASVIKREANYADRNSIGQPNLRNIFLAVSIDHRQSNDGVLPSLAVVSDASRRFAQLRTSASNRQ
ncbi:hypothetical protein P0D88_22705, partial [Paraburkholderia sp. RL18-103-BIB-C]|uniref:hypothetical protein n=1 Tax=Paraburkholderia sp. RL18-103-BIB-C TaxID=3031637 RepID=UPI0038B88E5F